MAVSADLLQRGALAEAGHVGLVADSLIAAPGVVVAGDSGDVGVGELAQHAGGHRAELAGIDEQGSAAPIAEPAVALGAGQEPEAMAFWLNSG